MKGLVVPQPLAALVAIGRLRFLLIDRPSNYKGLVIIQSSHCMEPEDTRETLSKFVHSELSLVNYSHWNGVALKLSSIVAVCSVIDNSFEMSDEIDLDSKLAKQHNISPYEYKNYFKDFKNHCHYLPLHKTYRLIEPIPSKKPKGVAARSRKSDPVGLWPVDESTKEAVKKQLEIYSKNTFYVDNIIDKISIDSLNFDFTEWHALQQSRERVYEKYGHKPFHLWQASRLFDHSLAAEHFRFCFQSLELAPIVKDDNVANI